MSFKAFLKVVAQHAATLSLFRTYLHSCIYMPLHLTSVCESALKYMGINLLKCIQNFSRHPIHPLIHLRASSERTLRDLFIYLFLSPMWREEQGGEDEEGSRTVAGR